MQDDLDLVSRLSEYERLIEKQRMKSISPVDGKYAGIVDPIREYLSEDSVWRCCVLVQQTLLDVGAEFGRGEKGKLKEAMKEIDTLNMKLLEQQITHHDQLAVIEEIGRHVSEETKVLIHPGTTSYDILDTARSYLFKRSWKKVMRPKVCDVISELCFLGRSYINIVQVGRTHLQNTSPVSFGAELAKYAGRLAERTEIADAAFNNLKGKISGIVGTGAGPEMIFGDNAEEFEKRVLEELDLLPDYNATQIVQKEGLADVGHALTTLNYVLVDLAEDMRHLYASSIQEVSSRPAEKRLGGSSTDPSKKNPINWENIAGKGHLVESGMPVLYATIPTNLSRDLRNSVLLRVQPATMMAFLYESLCRAYKSLKTLSVNEDKMKANLIPLRELPAEAMSNILKGEEFIHPEYGLPHNFVRTMTLKTKEEKLIDTCMKDPYFKEVFYSLPEEKQQILNGQIELYLGYSKRRALEINIPYAEKVTNLKI